MHLLWTTFVCVHISMVLTDENEEEISHRHFIEEIWFFLVCHPWLCRPNILHFTFQGTGHTIRFDMAANVSWI